MLEECGMQQEEMNEEMVGHAYADVAAGLARVAAEMCRERPIEVRLSELVLDLVADLLAKSDQMCAADRACDKYLRKAVAQEHIM